MEILLLMKFCLVQQICLARNVSGVCHHSCDLFFFKSQLFESTKHKGKNIKSKDPEHTLYLKLAQDSGTN